MSSLIHTPPCHLRPALARPGSRRYTRHKLTEECGLPTASNTAAQYCLLLANWGTVSPHASWPPKVDPPGLPVPKVRQTKASTSTRLWSGSQGTMLKAWLHRLNDELNTLDSREGQALCGPQIVLPAQTIGSSTNTESWHGIEKGRFVRIPPCHLRPALARPASRRYSRHKLAEEPGLPNSPLHQHPALHRIVWSWKSGPSDSACLLTT